MVLSVNYLENLWQFYHSSLENNINLNTMSGFLIEKCLWQPCTIHVKQQHNVGFFIFKFTLKYMLQNVYIN